MKINHLTAIICLCMLMLNLSCRKYLDAKPDKSLATPTSIEDLQALLDNRIMNYNYPSAGDNASDDYYLTFTNWQALSTPDFRNNYIYEGSGANIEDYSGPYILVMNSNVVLDEIDKVTKAGQVQQTADAVKGAAYFFRGYSFLHLANIFALPFRKGTTALGIPLKLRADITSSTTRSTLQETYNQIISDLKAAAAILPVQPQVKTRPSKPAAFGVLARTYLVMGEFELAGKYADSCLQLYSTLIDYNTVNANANAPFTLFNNEVIFHSANLARGGLLNPTRAFVDTLLYQSYASSDLRRKVFFRAGTGNGQIFKGDYGGSTSGVYFGGIATDEMYLIKAECAARKNDLLSAANDLNTLLSKRWAVGTYTPYSASSFSQENLLKLILTERRKELLYRNQLRWMDIRRLNQEDTFKKTLVRNLNGVVYSLTPDSKKFAYLLPLSVVQQTGIAQNDR